MYTKDLGERMTLRLTEEQRSFLVEMSNVTGVRPSEYIRMMLNSTMWAWNQSKQRQDNIVQEQGEYLAKELMKGGSERHENVETSEHNLV